MRTQKYIVRFYIDNTYEVIKIKYYIESCEIESEKVEYQGSLSDCEAWIRLTEKGYM